ncbi:MAG: hypothetical protein RJA76_2217 [Bacteroidota bacterium]|jgi:glycosyltransferase involved in cell wall biosynthesis
MKEGQNLHLSIVVPIYSGEKFVHDLFSRIKTLKDYFESNDAPLQIEELIFVNDNCIDNSHAIIEEIAVSNRWVTSLTLSKNFGQHAATIAGILHCSGDFVVTLDEDLQHEPEYIETLLHKALTENLDVVYAKAKNGPHNNFLRDFSSKSIKSLIYYLSGEKKVFHFNSFRLIRGSIARSAASSCNFNTYFDVSLLWFTNSIESCLLPMVDQRFQETKKSGYTLFKLLKHAKNLLFSLQIKIFKYFALAGFSIFAVGIFFALYVIISEYFQPGIFGSKGWPSLIIASVIFGSINIIFSSLILEFISDISSKNQGKPVFSLIERKTYQHVINYLQTNGRIKG